MSLAGFPEVIFDILGIPLTTVLELITQLIPTHFQCVKFVRETGNYAAILVLSYRQVLSFTAFETPQVLQKQ